MLTEESMARVAIECLEQTERDVVYGTISGDYKTLYLDGHRDETVSRSPRLMMVERESRASHQFVGLKKAGSSALRSKLGGPARQNFKCRYVKRGLIIPGNSRQTHRFTRSLVTISRIIEIHRYESDYSNLVEQKKHWHKIRENCGQALEKMLGLQQRYGRDSTYQNSWVSDLA
jgi:hypothetical protein